MTKKSSQHELNLIESINLYNVDVPNREIYLVGEESITDEDGGEPGVEFMMASRFIKNLRMLDVINQEPILVHMKTCGGDWQEGMAIYDAINNCESKVVILSYTHARSMSSIVLQAASKRVLMPHSYFLYHHGSYAIHGDWQKVQSIIDWDRKMPDVMAGIYVNRMVTSEHGAHYKANPNAIKEMLINNMRDKTDCFLSAPEAVRWGLADEVFDGDWTTLKLV